MASHLDHREPSEQVVVTEQDVADLRGKDPHERRSRAAVSVVKNNGEQGKPTEGWSHANPPIRSGQCLDLHMLWRGVSRGSIEPTKEPFSGRIDHF